MNRRLFQVVYFFIGNNATKSSKQNKMKDFTPKKTKRTRRPFKAVNVWQSKFGPTSVRAVYDVYSQKFDVDLSNMKNYSFSHCVEALRKLEDPNYEPTDRGSAY